MWSLEGDKLKHKIRLQYQATNNEVEYEALLKGLELAKSVEAKSILILEDSQLIMGQINGMYEAKEGRMKKILRKSVTPREEIQGSQLRSNPKGGEHGSRYFSEGSFSEWSHGRIQ